jgi:hypothetical protein
MSGKKEIERLQSLVAKHDAGIEQYKSEMSEKEKRRANQEEIKRLQSLVAKHDEDIQTYTEDLRKRGILPYNYIGISEIRGSLRSLQENINTQIDTIVNENADKHPELKEHLKKQLDEEISHIMTEYTENPKTKTEWIHFIEELNNKYEAAVYDLIARYQGMSAGKKRRKTRRNKRKTRRNKRKTRRN